MTESVQYEYYASLSGLLPKYAYTLGQHQAFYYYQFIDQDFSDLVTSATEFYTENSGLTPADSYTLSQHVDAYFTNLNYNASWEALLKADVQALLGLSGGGPSGLFTALFEATF